MVLPSASESIRTFGVNKIIEFLHFCARVEYIAPDWIAAIFFFAIFKDGEGYWRNANKRICVLSTGRLKMERAITFEVFERRRESFCRL